MITENEVDFHLEEDKLQAISADEGNTETMNYNLTTWIEKTTEKNQPPEESKFSKLTLDLIEV